MFKVTEKRTFTHPVTVMTPADGGHAEETFKCTFNYLDVDQVEGFDLNTKEGTTAFLQAIVNRLDDLVNDHGNPMTYNDALRDQVIKLGSVRSALIAAYLEAVSKAKTGN